MWITFSPANNHVLTLNFLRYTISEDRALFLNKLIPLASPSYSYGAKEGHAIAAASIAK